MTPLSDLFANRVKARALAYLFTAGALTGVLTLVFPHGPQVKELPLVILAVVAIAVAGLVYWRAERMTEYQLWAAVALGTLILTLANYFVGATALYPIIYTWTALYAFYFFELPVALANIALIAVSYGVLLAVFNHPSAVTRWILAVGTPLVVGILISRLLTRLRAEQIEAAERAAELRQTEARTRLVLDSAPDAFVTVDADGLIVVWNAAAERMFGWATEEAIGQPMRVLVIPPEFRERHDQRRLELVRSAGNVRGQLMEVEFVRRDGSRFSGEATVSKVEIGGEVVLPGFIRDITARLRRLEEREALLREQAARAEAERVAEMVSGMQLLVDAALAHRSLDAIVADLVTRVRGVVGADAAAIYLVDEGRLVLGASSGIEDPPPQARLEFGTGFVGRVAEQSEPLVTGHPEPGELAGTVLEGIECESLLGVPLMAAGEVTGVLVVCATERSEFGAEDLGVLRLAADRVALGIDHARVYEREHRIAETLQRSLLPERMPHLPGLAVAARYLPAAAEAEVGGDWYDVIPMPGGSIGLVMGDVAGKGLAAASMVGQLRSALRAYALEGHAPSQVIEQLNRLVWTELSESQMATLLYLVLDPADGSVRWVNAGHLPPLLVGEGGVSRFLESGRNVPLGVMPFPSFHEEANTLEPGATVVLYTDGLVERPGDHLDNGLERLSAAVRDAPSEPGAFSDHLLASLVPKGAAPDDVALLVLRNTPMADRFSAEFPTEPQALTSMRSLLRRWLRHARSSDQEIAEITTACGEAATNAIEHAGASGDTPFEVVGQLDGRDVHITVRDHGVWREPRQDDQGRGIGLIGGLMDDVQVTPTAAGTSVRMRRTLNGADAERGS